MATITERIRRWLRRHSRPTPHTPVTEAADEIREGIGPRMAPGPGALTTEVYDETVEGRPARGA